MIKLHVGTRFSSFVVRQFCSSQSAEGITHGANGGVYRITFDRPDRFNSLTPEMYEEMGRALRLANYDPNTRLTVLSGVGRFYSSGIDLSNLKSVLDDRNRLIELSERVIETVGKTIRELIDHRKPVIALVNGSAIGFAVTSLTLCDYVLAVDSATFQTPFTALGYSPESCSSYTFPRLMGQTRTAGLLIFGQTFTAADARDVGLISRIVSADKFEEEANKLINQWIKLPLESLIENKRLLRGWEKEKLHQVNDFELAVEKKRWISEESVCAVRAFLNKNKRL